MSLRASLYAELSDREKQEYNAFERAVLLHHVRPRDGRAGQPFVLDKRNALLGQGNRETLRDPSDADWPYCGRSTRDRNEAEQWARSHYIPQLWRVRAAASVHPHAGSMTVREAVERYVRARVQITSDVDGNRKPVIPRRLQSRISMLRQHVVPAFGRTTFATLTRTIVREEVEALQVTGRDADGKPIRRAAKHGHKLNFLRALTAVWNDVFPDVAAPFAGAVPRPVITHEADESAVIYDLGALQETLSAAEGKGAMAPSEVRRAIIGAMHRDRALMARPNVAPAMIPNTTYLIVLLVATGARISEVLRMRWADIDFERGLILIRQSKRHTNKRGRPKPEIRIIPLQNALEPWLEELRVLSAITDPAGNPSFVIRSNPNAAANELGVQNTMLARLSRVLRHAGVKPQGKASHWGRATHASWGKHAPALKHEELQHFLGHAPFSGTTKEYVAMIVELLRDEHRKYIPLPTPVEIQSALADFVPAPEDPVRRRKPQSRTTEAKIARRERRAVREVPAATADEFVRRLFT